MHNSSITLQDTNVILPLQIFFSNITQFPGVYIALNFHPKISMSLGIGLVVLGVFCSSFCKSLFWFSVTYGVIYGLGVGMAYTTPLLLSWSHFPKIKGRISGVIISGFGFGAFCFNFVSTFIINPNNEKASEKEKNDGVTDHYFKDSIAENLPSTLRLLSLMYLCLGTVGIILTKRLLKSEESESGPSLCPSIKEGVKSSVFWQTFIMCLCSVSTGLYVAGAYKNFGNSTIDNDDFLAIVGSISSLFNGGFRYVWGYIMDKTNFRKTYFILIGLQSLTIGTFYFVASVDALFLIWVCILMSCEGGHFAIFPTLHAQIYGQQMGGKVFSIFFYCFGISSLTSFVIQLYVVQELGYEPMFFILLGLSLVSFGMNLFFSEKSPWAKDFDVLVDSDEPKDSISN